MPQPAGVAACVWRAGEPGAAGRRAACCPSAAVPGKMAASRPRRQAAREGQVLPEDLQQPEGTREGGGTSPRRPQPRVTSAALLSWGAGSGASIATWRRQRARRRHRPSLSSRRREGLITARRRRQKSRWPGSAPPGTSRLGPVPHGPSRYLRARPGASRPVTARPGSAGRAVAVKEEWWWQWGSRGEAGVPQGQRFLRAWRLCPPRFLLAERCFWAWVLLLSLMGFLLPEHSC